MTDDAGVVLHYLPEVPIHILPGEESNRKITYKEDLETL
jgi:2-C-methyl-D-erythritol 4-phosphate cytidylyltransferase